MVEELGASIPMEEEVQTLTRLGLTPNQGKVFLTLIHKGNSTVKEISRISGVPREKVYEILSALQEIGLIRKTITAPATFEGIPLSDAISFLIKQKTIEHEDLKLRAASILHNYELSCRNQTKLPSWC
jgi:sugar-specific transcriptional regulator TrmB